MYTMENYTSVFNSGDAFATLVKDKNAMIEHCCMSFAQYIEKDFNISHLTRTVGILIAAKHQGLIKHYLKAANTMPKRGTIDSTGAFSKDGEIREPQSNEEAMAAFLASIKASKPAIKTQVQIDAASVKRIVKVGLEVDLDSLYNTPEYSELVKYALAVLEFDTTKANESAASELLAAQALVAAHNDKVSMKAKAVKAKSVTPSKVAKPKAKAKAA